MESIVSIPSEFFRYVIGYPPVGLAICFSLLNPACEAVERTDHVDNETVELRIRGVGNQVLFRLDVPERWGALWAQKYLAVFDLAGTRLIRERRQGERRVVLVVREGSIS